MLYCLLASSVAAVCGRGQSFRLVGPVSKPEKEYLLLYIKVMVVINLCCRLAGRCDDGCLCNMLCQLLCLAQGDIRMD